MSNDGAVLPSGGVGPARALPAGPVGIMLLAMVLFQGGGAVGKTLFPVVGPLGASSLRIGLASLVLLAFARPWRVGVPRAAWPSLVVYGLSIAGLNTFFYLAIRTIPIGVGVAINMLGPLSVALAHSRRRADIAWALLAGAGVALLLPLGPALAKPLDPVGLCWCSGSAACWISYILAGRRVGRHLPGLQITACGMTVAALAVLPLGLATAGPALVSRAALPTGLLIAVLFCAVPYRLEFVALTRLPPRLFGVLVSLEPAAAALASFLVLGERLSVLQGAAVGLVIVSSVGATLTGERDAPGSPPPPD